MISTAKYEFSNAVDHPDHYTKGDIECIEAIKASMCPSGFVDYCKGNVLKYLWRWESKGGLMDLQKAQTYLNWMVETAQKYAETEEETVE